MGFKRLLTVALMALFCASTATAASQLNSVQVTPKANEATVTLRTTGSYAHKEYRPDEHLMLVDLTGVTADPAVERTVALKSAVLRGYKLSSYTSASGSEVTRVELELGDNVGLEVIDRSDGLQILLSSGGIARTSTAASNIASSSPLPATSASVAPKPALVEPAKLLRPAPETVAPAMKNSETLQAATAPARPADRPAARLAEPNSSSNVLAPMTIRNISVQRGHDTLDVIIDGPNSAHSFLLKNPDRLVLDFSNVGLRSSVKNIAVHTKDVLQVRVGRFQSEPPITRIVIDLSGPRSFDVVPSAQQVIVRIKTEDAAMLSSPLKAAPALVLASVQAPVVASVKPVSLQVKSEDAVKSPAPLKAVAAPVPASVQAPVVAPVKPVSVQAKSDDAVQSSQPLKAPVVAAVQPVSVQVKSEEAVKSPAPLKAVAAPVPASVQAPVVASVKPVSVQVKSDDAVKRSQPLTLFPGQAPVEVPVVASVKPPVVQAKNEDAAKSSPPLASAPAPAPGEAPVVASVKPPVVQAKNEDAAKSSPPLASAPAPAPGEAPVVASVKPPVVQAKNEDAAKSSPPLASAPAPAPVEAPVVASVKPLVVQAKNEDAAKSSPPLASAPAPAPVEAPVVASVKPLVVQAKNEDAAKSSPALTPAPAPAPVEAPVVASVKPLVVQAKNEDAAKSSPALTSAPAPAPAPVEIPVVASVKPAVVTPSQPLKVAPAPELASADVPEAAGRMNPGGSSNGAYAGLVSASSAPRAEEAAMLASNTTSRLREQQISEPKSRAGIAADTLATSARAGQPPVGTEQSSGRAMLAATPKYTGEPISVNLKDVDLKDFFRLIHEISGLNIVLDPNVRGTLTLVLDDVPWDQALDIVLKNNALDRELQGNVLRIAATDTLRKEAVDRRAQSEAVALAVDRQTITRFLSYAKARDIVPTIKRFLTARGDVISDERTNALIISDIPSVLPNLDRLISQLDRKSQEVEIEVRVVSATRSFSRDLGVQLGFNWGNGVTGVGGLSTLSQGTSTSSTGTTTVTNSNPGTIPLFTNLPATEPTTGFTLSNITKSYGIDAILTAAETHNLAKVLSRPRVVTQSNVKAEVKQGVKIPVYTQGTANANASVSYVDAVLRLSVTPQITSDNTIFLTVDVENTQPSGTINSNYILTTQQATTQVLVTDGGTVVIGGVIQTTNTVSTTQTPVLGSIPWLGNLFKERSVKTETDELIFFITPKIIQT